MFGAPDNSATMALVNETLNHDLSLIFDEFSFVNFQFWSLLFAGRLLLIPGIKSLSTLVYTAVVKF